MHANKRHCTAATAIEFKLQAADKFSALPEEMLEYIFGFLSAYELLQARQVSSLFYRISQSKILWQSLTDRLLETLRDFTKYKDYQRFFNTFPCAFQLLAHQAAHADVIIKNRWENSFKTLCINKLIVPFLAYFIFNCETANNSKELTYFLNKILVASEVAGIDTELLLNAAYQRYKRFNSIQFGLDKTLIFPASALTDLMLKYNFHSSVDSKIAHWLIQHKVHIDESLFHYYLTTLLQHALIYARKDLAKVFIRAGATIKNARSLLRADYAHEKLRKAELDNTLTFYRGILQELIKENSSCVLNSSAFS